MFFGLEVKANQKGAKLITIDSTLKLSQAVLEPTKNAKKEPVTLLAEYNKKVFIIAVLDPNLSWQAPLDLFFEGGSQVKFFIRGTGTVHLTGYENFDDIDNVSLSMSSEDELETSSDELEMSKNSKKSKSPKAKTNGLKTPSKKADDDEIEALNSQTDSDDDDFDVADLDVDALEDSDEDEEDSDEDEDEDLSDEDMDDDDSDEDKS